MQTSPAWQRRSAVGLGTFAALTAGAATLGARSTDGGTQRWYRRLKKPPFQPPAAAFPIAWTALYGLIALSGWRVWRKPSGAARSLALELWGVQLGLNAAWSWLFFGKRRKRTALADLGLLWVSIAGYTAAARRVDRPAARMMVPYLGWVAFAGVLNAEIVRRNP
ncbi:tryptophan-rich sensory protein [Aggregicoccus sp. 17bor-14]|uniref:TspO/MBR family protein n=1 Tax=Myxococcaceae TaxID=31 RepID=UPI00129CD669|nr:MULTISPECIES: TspO/MBR family protein [Myxococcaceae]MBF5042926.1 tryptophan-rich sensory protein [Simulacricoccus sp. 17bor-14]MRI88693.1 tryptophan-rich sensory protein [Aggregicoccus sp. 17bor-14]